MDSKRIKEIENVFRNATSSDELFDAFQEALELNLNDLEIFKMLLANPALSADEIKMFTEKLIKEFPINAFDLCMWTAKVFENDQLDPHRLEDAIQYYSRANFIEPSLSEPLTQMLGLYNYGIDVLANRKILDIVESRVKSVKKKSEVFYVLADHYKKVGNIERAAKYLALAERSAEREV